MTKNLQSGDTVSWNTPQGETHGTVERKVTSTTRVRGYTAKASKDNPEFIVRSDKTGAEAVHQPEQLKKR